MKNLKNCHDISDLRRAAKNRLPKSIFDFLDGGADDEISMRMNRSTFGEYDLVPDAPKPVNGDLHLPDGPGLGIEVDESVLDSYPYVLGPWSIFELESPPSKLALSGDHALPWADK